MDNLIKIFDGLKISDSIINSIKLSNDLIESNFLIEKLTNDMCNLKLLDDCHNNHNQNSELAYLNHINDHMMDYVMLKMNNLKFLSFDKGETCKIFDRIDISNSDQPDIIRVENIFKNSVFKYANLKKSIFTWSKFINCNMQYINASSCVLIGVDFSNSDLSGAYMYGSILMNSNMTGVKLSGTNLENCNLSGVNFSRNTINSVNFNGANMTGSHLNGTKFINCDFTDTNLSMAYIQGAIFDDTCVLSIL